MNKDIAQALQEIATLMKLTGENDFRSMAFDRAARNIESFQGDLSELIENQQLSTIKGIGKSIANDILQYTRTGTIPVLEKLREKVSPELMQWLDIPGLGPKKIHAIHQNLAITRLDQLKTACEDGRVSTLPGMGKKTAEKILLSISWMEQHSKRCRIDEATIIAHLFIDELKKSEHVHDISVAGSLRRALETIGDIDILLSSDSEHASKIMDQFVRFHRVTEIIGKGDTKSSVRTTSGRQVDLRIVEPHHFHAALLYFTGSKEHNIVLRQRARSRNLILNEYGLYPISHKKNPGETPPLLIRSESDIYHRLDLHFIPPEMREDYFEFDLFEAVVEATARTEGKPDQELVSSHDLKGVIHLHTRWSDGNNSIEEMANACIKQGYQYMCVTDHSRSAAYAGGLTIEQVYAQWKEIDRVNNELEKKGRPFRILKGTETDILADGTLDYPDKLLKGFDLVIASVHSGIDMPADKMLDRLKKAVSNRYAHIIGHPTGRLLLRRERNKVDLEKLIPFAADHHTAIEINANPWRLDLDWRYGGVIRSTGLMSVICPDAHDINGLDHMIYGIGTARKAGLAPAQVLNTLSLKDLSDWLNQKQ